MDNIYLKPTTIFKPFQKVGIVAMLKRPKMVLGDATGLGKTIQMFGAFSYYKTKYQRAKMLVLTDKSLIHQVENEVHKFFHGLRTCNIYELERVDRYKVYEEWLLGDKDILVGNYGSFRDDVLTASSMRVSMSAPARKEGYKSPAKGYKGHYGQLTVSQKGALVYKTVTDNIQNANGLGRHKDAIYDHFEIETLSGEKIKVYASIKRMEAGKRRFVVQLHHEHDGGKGSDRTTSSPFIDFLEEANKDDKLPLFSAFDEAAIMKETDSRTYKMGEYISKHSTRAIAVTATVTKGELWEAYNVFQCIGITLMPKEKFKDKFYIYEPNYMRKPRVIKGKKVYPQELTGYRNVEQFQGLIAPYYLGRAKKDVAKELPAFGPKRYEVDECQGVKVALSELYTKAMLEKRPASVNQLRSALLTPQMYSEDLPADYISATVAEFIRILKINFSGEKIVVYIDLKQPIDILMKILPDHMPKYYKKMLAITGETDNREQTKQLFINDPHHNILFINTAGLKGLNLQVSGDLFPLMPPFTGGDYIQMAGRISRIGTEQTAFTLHRIVQRDSVATDGEIIIQSELRLIDSITPNSVDEGLIEPYFDDKVIQARGNPEEYIIEGFKNRRSRYLKEDLGF